MEGSEGTLSDEGNGLLIHRWAAVSSSCGQAGVSRCKKLNTLQTHRQITGAVYGDRIRVKPFFSSLPLPSGLRREGVVQWAVDPARDGNRSLRTTSIPSCTLTSPCHATHVVPITGIVVGDAIVQLQSCGYLFPCSLCICGVAGWSSCTLQARGLACVQNRHREIPAQPSSPSTLQHS